MEHKKTITISQPGAKAAKVALVRRGLTMLRRSASDQTAPLASSSFMRPTCCSALAQCSAVKPRPSATFTSFDDDDVSKCTQSTWP
jgi:hypothetical protein